MNRLLLGLFLFSGVALACEKIDYVEAKDWPVEKVEKALCDAKEETVKLVIRQVNLQDSPYAREYTVPIAVCEAQSALYSRVIENVHKRKLPNCKYK